MNKALHISTRVGPGNKIEISDPGLIEGESVEVIVVRPSSELTAPRRTLLELLDSLPPGPHSYSTWEEFEARFREERDAWDH